MPSWINAHVAVTQVTGHLLPRMPAALKWALGIGAVAAIAADVYEDWRRAQPRPPDGRDQAAAEIYRQAAERQRPPPPPAPAAAAVAVAYASAHAPAAYLLEEGKDSVDTDCWSCASGHMAAMEGSLRRAAQETDQAGSCDEECQRCLELACEEPAALAALDWDDASVARFPPEQQAVVSKHLPRLQGLAATILDGPHRLERGELVEGAALLKESVRFTAAERRRALESGASAAEADLAAVRQVEVERRRADAEAHLATAERLSVTAFSADVSDDLRHVRQDVANRMHAPAALASAGERASDVARRANAPYWQDTPPLRWSALADQLAAQRQEFYRSRQQLAGYHAMGARPGQVPPGASARVRRELADQFSLPAEAQAAELTQAADVGRYSANLDEGLRRRGVPVLASTLPSDLEGRYLPDPAPGTVQLAPAVYDHPDRPYNLQVRIHEGCHALMHNADCWPLATPSHDREEADAQLCTIATSERLAVPIEYHDGTIEPPGSRALDWAKLRRFDPTAERNVRWASAELAAAAEGDADRLARAVCPALAP